MKAHEEKLCKLVLFIVNIAMKVIRKVISCKLLNDRQTFISYLADNKHTLFHASQNEKPCCQCKRDDKFPKESMFTKQQFHLMFNDSGSVPHDHVHINGSNKIYCLYKLAVNENASLDSFDVSVANSLIVCCCTSKTVNSVSDRQSILNWTRNIKEHRNEIFHIASSENLSDDEFKIIWQRLEGAVIGLADMVGRAFCDEITEGINILKNNNNIDLKDPENQAKLTEVLVQCKQDLNLMINQRYETSFYEKLKRAGINKLEDIKQQCVPIYKEETCINQTGININIVETRDIMEHAIKEQKSLDFVLRVQTPQEWDDDSIIETIRRMCNEINKGGNIIIKETTLAQFILIVEMLVETFSEKQNLKHEINIFFRKIFEQCNIDTKQSETVNVSVQPLMEIGKASNSCLDDFVVTPTEASDEDQAGGSGSQLEKGIEEYKPEETIGPNKWKKERKSEVELVFIKSLVVQRNEDSFFTSCAVWSNNHYIFIDSNNMCLIVYDHENDDTKKIELRNKPFSMVIIDDDNVAISFPARQEIGIFNLSTIGNNGPTRIIKVNGKCYTLTKNDDGTLFVYIDGKGIHTLNISKDELKSLGIKIKLFVPHSDEICVRNNRLFYTNRNKESVFCSDMNDNVLWKLENKLKNPTALTCDQFGNVYVTDLTSHQLYFIAADGQSHKVLLSRKDKLLLPTFVYFCARRNCLLIVNRDNGYAASYSIKYVK